MNLKCYCSCTSQKKYPGELIYMNFILNLYMHHSLTYNSQNIFLLNLLLLNWDVLQVSLFPTVWLEIFKGYAKLLFNSQKLCTSLNFCWVMYSYVQSQCFTFTKLSLLTKLSSLESFWPQYMVFRHLNNWLSTECILQTDNQMVPISIMLSNTADCM